MVIFFRSLRVPITLITFGCSQYGGSKLPIIFLCLHLLVFLKLAWSGILDLLSFSSCLLFSLVDCLTIYHISISEFFSRSPSLSFVWLYDHEFLWLANHLYFVLKDYVQGMATISQVPARPALTQHQVQFPKHQGINKYKMMNISVTHKSKSIRHLQWPWFRIVHFRLKRFFYDCRNCSRPSGATVCSLSSYGRWPATFCSANPHPHSSFATANPH